MIKYLWQLIASNCSSKENTLADLPFSNRVKVNIIIFFRHDGNGKGNCLTAYIFTRPNVFLGSNACLMGSSPFRLFPLSVSAGEERIQRRIAVLPLLRRRRNGGHEFQEQAAAKRLQAHRKHCGQNPAGKAPRSLCRDSEKAWGRTPLGQDHCHTHVTGPEERTLCNIKPYE